jgi:hypothetical protein
MAANQSAGGSANVEVLPCEVKMLKMRRPDEAQIIPITETIIKVLKNYEFLVFWS